MFLDVVQCTCPSQLSLLGGVEIGDGILRNALSVRRSLPGIMQSTGHVPASVEGHHVTQGFHDFLEEDGYLETWRSWRFFRLYRFWKQLQHLKPTSQVAQTAIAWYTAILATTNFDIKHLNFSRFTLAGNGPHHFSLRTGKFRFWKRASSCLLNILDLLDMSKAGSMDISNWIARYSASANVEWNDEIRFHLSNPWSYFSCQIGRTVPLQSSSLSTPYNQRFGKLMVLQVVFFREFHRFRYDVANHHGWFPERCIKKRNSPLRPRPSPLPAGTPVPPKPPLLTTKAPFGEWGWWLVVGGDPRLAPVEVPDVDTFARTATPPPDDEVPQWMQRLLLMWHKMCSDSNIWANLICWILFVTATSIHWLKWKTWFKPEVHP